MVTVSVVVIIISILQVGYYAKTYY